MSWAQVVKKNNPKPLPSQPAYRVPLVMDQPLEERIIRMEHAIDRILGHLELKITQKEQSKTSNSQESSQPINKRKGKEEPKKVKLPPAIISKITSSEAELEDKLDQISNAFLRYYEKIELRMAHMETNFNEILAGMPTAYDQGMYDSSYEEQ